VSLRRDPDRRTERRPSNLWHRANKARDRVHHRVPDSRRGGPHKLTTAPSCTISVVVVEDSNLAGMLRGCRLARSSSDAGFSEIGQRPAYGTTRRGARLSTADRGQPSRERARTVAW